MNLSVTAKIKSSVHNSLVKRRRIIIKNEQICVQLIYFRVTVNKKGTNQHSRMNKKPVTKLDLNQRYKAIIMYESQPERLKKHKIAEIANYYSCSETQIYELIKIKEEFKKKYEEVLEKEGKVEGYNLPVDYSAHQQDMLFKKVHEWYLANVTNEVIHILSLVS